MSKAMYVKPKQKKVDWSDSRPGGSSSMVVASKRHRYTGLPRTVSTRNPRPEIKYFDYAIVSASLTATGNGNSVFVPSNGTGNQNFLGTSVNIKSVYGHFTVESGPGSSGQVPSAWRVLIIYDRQSNSSTPAITDIFADTTPSQLSFMNIANKDRFVVLSNEFGVSNPNGEDEVHREVYIKVGFQATFQNVAGSQTPTTGAILVVAFSDQATTANQPILNGIWRTKFVDV